MTTNIVCFICCCYCRYFLRKRLHAVEMRGCWLDNVIQWSIYRTQHTSLACAFTTCSRDVSCYDAASLDNAVLVVARPWWWTAIISHKGISSRADTREWSPEPYRAVWHEERSIWRGFSMRTFKLWWMTYSQSQCLQRIHNFGCFRLCGRQNGNFNAVTCIHARFVREA